jgi:multidrug efflux pump subunit AcrA (membrane-fusion protein)
MKTKAFSLPVILAVLLAACTGVVKTPAALPTIVLGNSASTPAPNTSTGNDTGVIASGVIVADQEAHIAFRVAGNVKLVSVAVGDQVQAGQALVQLDDTTQQIQLQQATLALQELTSPEAIANARLAITNAESDVINAQSGLNNTQYWKNDALIQSYYANFVIAKANLDKAQTAYDNAHVGEYINNANEAVAYQALYNAKQAYDTAHYYWSLYSQKPTQRQLDEAQAKLDLANAQLTNARNYLAALTDGSVPDDASGSALVALKKAKLAIQTAQDNLDAIRLVSPFPGEIASIAVSTGDFISPGQVILVISDVTHLHVETTDLSERDVPKIKLGQAVTVSIKATDQDTTGRVRAISPLADNLGGDVVYKVIIVLDDLPAGLLAGMSVEVQFKTSQ